MSKITSVATILGFRLREIRENQNLSQATVASTLGMTNAGWGKLEKGINALSVDNLVSVCELFEIKPSELMKEVEKNIETLKKDGWDVSSKRVDQDALLTGWSLSSNTALAGIMAMTPVVAGPIGGLIGIALSGYWLAQKLKTNDTDDNNEK